MAIDPKCHVEVGTHFGPYWQSGKLKVCNRHKHQYNQAYPGRDWDWIRQEEPSRGN